MNGKSMGNFPYSGTTFQSQDEIIPVSNYAGGEGAFAGEKGSTFKEPSFTSEKEKANPIGLGSLVYAGIGKEPEREKDKASP